MPYSSISEYQGTKNLPEPEGVTTGTDLVALPPMLQARYQHFWELFYDLRPQTHLVRLLSVLLGQSGVGALRKRMLLARLQSIRSGTHFYDLDRFWGSLYGVSRRIEEDIKEINPAGLVTQEGWNELEEADAAYRHRIFLLGQAVHHSPTPLGIELVAEAIASADCQVFEMWQGGLRRTWSEVETLTLNDMDGMTWDELETSPSQDELVGTSIVRPRRPLTDAEIREIVAVIDTVRPITSRVIVDPAGVPIYRQINPRTLYSPSTYWELRTSYQPVVAGSIDQEQPPVLEYVPPITRRQTQTIQLNNDVRDIDSYVTNTAGLVVSEINTVAERDPENGQLVFRSATGALTSAETLERAQMALDFQAGGINNFSDLEGIAQSSSGWVFAWNVLVTESISFSTFGDGPTPAGVTSLPNYNTTEWAPYGPSASLPVGFAPDDISIYVPRGDTGADQEGVYWSSEPRSWDEETLNEVLEIEMVSPRDITNIDFEVSIFPIVWTCSVYSRGSWRVVESGSVVPPAWWFDQITRAPDYANASPLATLQLPPTDVVNFQPEVDDAGWKAINVQIPHTPGGEVNYWYQDIERVRLQFSRRYQHSFHGEDDFEIGDIVFPVKVRQLQMSQVITTIEQMEEFIERPQPPIQVDLIDRLAIYSGKTWPAKELLGGGVWRSDVQVAPEAVVPLYVDVRDLQGEPQVVSRLWLDPLWEGGRVNLYWTDEDPDPDELGSPGTYRLHETTDVTGDITFNATGMRWPADPAWVDLPIDEVMFDAHRPWSFFVKISPSWPTAANESHTIFDFAGRRLVVGGGKVRLILGDGAQVEADVDASSNTDISISGNIDDDSASLLIAWDDEEVSAGHVGTGLAGAVSATMRIGAAEDPDHVQSKPLNSIIRTFMLVQGNSDVSSEPTGAIPGAIWGFFPGWITDTNPTGGRGGAGDPYQSLKWDSVPIDSKVERGYIHTPLVHAKYLCLEFTNLAPEPIDTNVVIDRETRLFPADQSRPTAEGRGSTKRGQETLEDVAGQLNFSDSASLDRDMLGSDALQRSRSGSDLVKPDTEGTLYKHPLTRRQAVSRNSRWDHRLEQWHQGSLAPRQQDRKHRYEVQSIPHNTQIGYFCGLRELRVYREDHAVVGDTEVYSERFFDMENVKSLTWQQDPGRLFSTTNSPVATSRVWKSHNRVLGVQFASQQSPSVQVIPDHNFVDEEFLGSTDWSLSEQWHAFGAATLIYDDINHAVVVYWTEPELATVEIGEIGEVIDDPVHPVSTGATPTFSNPADGGIESPPVNVSDEGYAWPAVRFTPLQDPGENTFKLQLINALDESVIKSVDVSGKRNETKESYFAYEIGSIVAGGTPVKVRFVGSTTVRVEKMSLFDEAIVWEFSVDGGQNWHIANRVRNNVNGFLRFPEVGRELCWRVKGFRPDLNVSSLQVRPWYEGLVPSRGEVQTRGPNVSVYDVHPPIHEDPEFRAWNLGVPYSWFLRSQRYPLLATEGIVQLVSRFIARSQREHISFDDSVTRMTTLYRNGHDSITLTDTADHEGSSFDRDAEDSLSFTDQVTGVLFTETTIVRPPDAPPSSKY